jgi:uracil-DNA glycosylase
MPTKDPAPQLSLFGTVVTPPVKKPEPEERRVPVSPIFSAYKVKEEPFPGVDTLDGLSAALADCRRCKLCEQRTHVVFGEGNPAARLMLVGEGPGANEDITGRPFVGAAGQLLDKILASVGFTREEVFIANVVKCRPPGNRLPEPAESQACLPFLLKQFDIIKPGIVLCLGALATQTLVDPRARITAMRGLWSDKAGIRFMPTFHPAALLRDPGKKRPVWEDMQKLRAYYEEVWSPGGPPVF